MTKAARKITAAKSALKESKKHPNSFEAIREVAEKTLDLAVEIFKDLNKAEEKKEVVDKVMRLLYEHDQELAQEKYFVPSRSPSAMWPSR